MKNVIGRNNQANHRNVESLPALSWCAFWAFFLTSTFAPLFAQTPAIPCDSTLKQVLLLVDVSGSMAENERLLEVKQFSLRMLKEREKERLLYKIISFGGECNDIQTDVDWTRDASVISAGIKSLYLRGGTPLGSALEYSIDAVKKSAYPDQTHILLFNDGANTCGDVREILTRRGKEIPCVRIHVVGIELDDEDTTLANRSKSDLEAIRSLGNGDFLRVQDVREVRGLSFAENQVIMHPQSFPPRIKKPKPEVAKKEAVKKDSTSPTTAQTPPTQATKRDSVQTPPTQATKRDSSQTSSIAANDTKASSSRSTPETTNQPERKETSPTQDNQQEKKQENEPKQVKQKQIEQKQVEQKRVEEKQMIAEDDAQSRTTTSKTEVQAQKNTRRAKEPENTKPVRQKNPPKAASQAAVMQSSEPSFEQSSEPSSKESASPKPSRQYSSEQRQVQTQEQPQSTVHSSVASNTISPDSFSSREEGIIVFYPTGSDKLLPQMKQGLERLVERLRSKSVLSISVEGHSSIEGNGATNLRLSVQRASGVAAFLRSRLGLSERIIVWNAFGELKPLAANTTEAGRQENRRVEVRVQVAE